MIHPPRPAPARNAVLNGQAEGGLLERMKHFVVEITHVASPEAVAAVVGRHREYLQKGYDAGLLLLSGPQVPLTGGLVVARAESLEAIQAYFAQDPYALAGTSKHRFIEFNPVKHVAALADWVAGK
jgi:uncharacterized protein YciI